MSDKKKRLYIKVPTDIVRNADKEKYISNDEFVLYARLCWLYFRNENEPKNVIEIDHRALMRFCRIDDTRTFKKRMKNLSKNNLIIDFKDKLPTKGKLTVHFNEKAYEEDPYFTMLNVSVFEYYRNEQINTNAFRQLFYYKSHINAKFQNVTNPNFCFVGYETLAKRLKMGRDSIKEANDQLQKSNLVTIEKHELKSQDEYDENDELITTKYNNHYIVNRSLF